jgi:hypothetical protein
MPRLLRWYGYLSGLGSDAAYVACVSVTHAVVLIGVYALLGAR